MWCRIASKRAVTYWRHTRIECADFGQKSCDESCDAGSHQRELCHIGGTHAPKLLAVESSHRILVQLQKSAEVLSLSSLRTPDQKGTEFLFGISRLSMFETTIDACSPAILILYVTALDTCNPRCMSCSLSLSFNHKDVQAHRNQTQYQM